MKRRPSSACLPAFPPRHATGSAGHLFGSRRPRLRGRNAGGEVPLANFQWATAGLTTTTLLPRRRPTPASGTARVLRLTTLWSAVATKVPGTALSRRRSKAAARRRSMGAQVSLQLDQVVERAPRAFPATDRRRRGGVGGVDQALLAHVGDPFAAELAGWPAPAQAPPTPVAGP